MGSPLSSVIADFYMEDFEERELDCALNKPLCWFRYLDTIVIETHGPEKLKDFLNNLNSIHQCIQFIMETETEGHLPFFDIDIYRIPDGSVGHRVYLKSTYTNPYLNAGSHHHHPSKKQAVFSTQVHGARTLCDQERLHADLVFLRDVFRQKGYNDRQIQGVLNRRLNISQPDDNPGSVAFLHYVGTIFKRISRVLSQHNTKSVG
jgi:hypothetical protein